MKKIILTLILSNLFGIAIASEPEESQMTPKAARVLSKNNNIIQSGINCAAEFTAKNCGKAAVATVVETAAIPTAVGIASATGVTASTGTAIATLSGAAATSSTLAAVVGGTLATGLATVAGITVAPAVAGGAVVVGVGALVAIGINSLIFDNEDEVKPK
jgi:predicted sugar kinase